MPIHMVFCNGEAERLTLAKPRTYMPTDWLSQVA